MIIQSKTRLPSKDWARIRLQKEGMEDEEEASDFTLMTTDFNGDSEFAVQIQQLCLGVVICHA